MVPLWHEAQVPSTSAWLTLVTGFQVLVEWQSSQVAVVAMWVADLPVAVVPLWQDEQLPLIFACEKLAGDQADVRWQLLQSAVVARWFAGLPEDCRPLWQDAQRVATLA